MPPFTQIRGVSYQCKNRGVFVADRRKWLLCGWLGLYESLFVERHETFDTCL